MAHGLAFEASSPGCQDAGMLLLLVARAPLFEEHLSRPRTPGTWRGWKHSKGLPHAVAQFVHCPKAPGWGDEKHGNWVHALLVKVCVLPRGCVSLEKKGLMCPERSLFSNSLTQRKYLFLMCTKTHRQQWHLKKMPFTHGSTYTGYQMHTHSETPWEGHTVAGYPSILCWPERGRLP